MNEHATVPPLTARPVRRRWLLVCVALVLAAGIGWYAWRRLAAPVPPELPGDVHEDAVLEIMREARADVLGDPYSGAFWGKLAQVLIANGHGELAVPCLLQAERLSPEEPAWPYLLAVHFLRADRRQALEQLRRAVACDPENAVASLFLAEMLLENGDTAEAQTLADNVLARQPNNRRAQLLKGMLAVAGDDLAGAVVRLEEAARSPSAEKRASIQLAIVHHRLGNEEMARTYSRKAQGLPPDSNWPDPIMAEVHTLTRGRQAQQRAADQYKAQARLQERVQVLRQLAEQSTDAQAPVDLALALNDVGDHKAAEQALREAIRRQPDRFNAQLLLVITLFRQAEKLAQQPQTLAAAQEKYREAADTAKASAEPLASRASAYYFLGRALFRLKQPKEAIAALKQAVDLRPQELAFHLELADVLADTGQYAAAVTQLEQAQASVGESRRLRDRLAELRPLIKK
jgi:tetratricopeptide (TPR) repeat protein